MWPVPKTPLSPTGANAAFSMNNVTGDGETEATGVERERQRHRWSKPLLSLGLSFPMWLTRHVGDALSSVAQSCPTLCDPTDCSTPGFPVHHHQLLELAQAHVHHVGDAIQPSHPLSSLLIPPSIFPSIRVFSNESVLCITWPKYWSFSFSIIPSKEHPGLISFRMDWFGLLPVQGTVKIFLHHHSSKASILQCSAFFMVQLSYPYMITRKTSFE